MLHVSSSVTVNIGSKEKPNKISAPVVFDRLLAEKDIKDTDLSAKDREAAKSWKDEATKFFLEVLETGNLGDVVKYYNQGVEFFSRQKVSNKIRSENVDPEKAIEKLTEDMFNTYVKMGLNKVDKATIKAQITAQYVASKDANTDDDSDTDTAAA